MSLPTPFDPSASSCGRSDLPSRSELVSGRLANGLRYVIWPLPAQRDVSLRLVVDAGSFHEAENERGLAHFLEHMAFRGSENLPGGARVTELEALGLHWGAHNNAFTSYEHTSYKLDLPSATVEVLERGLFVLRETADRLTLSADALETERGVVLAELRLADNAIRRESEAGLEMIYGDWLTNHRPLGSPDVIRRVSRDDMARFYRRWYRPQRMTVVVAGGIDPAVAERLIRARFGDATSATEDPQPPIPLPALVAAASTAVRLVPERGNNINVMLVTARPIDCFLDGYREREAMVTLGVAQTILARRLTERARAEHGGFSAPRVGSWVQFQQARVGSISLVATTAHWREAVAAAEQELRRALTFGFTDQEVATTKATFKTYLHQAIADDASRKSPARADALVDSIQSHTALNAVEPTVAHLDRMLDALDGARLKMALQNLWVDGDRRWLLGGTFEPDVTEATVRDAVRASELTVVTAPEQGVDKSFAYDSFGPAGVIVSRKRPRRDLTVATFENQVRVAVLSTTDASDKVQVGIDLFDCGRLYEPAGLDGLSYLAGQYFLSGGLAAHSFADVSQRWWRQGISLRFSVGSTRCRLSAVAPRAVLPLALHVMAAYLAAPGFREDAFASLQNGIIDRYAAASESSAAAILEYQLLRRRCAGDVRCGIPEVAMLKARRLEEIKSWLAPLLRDAPLIVSISSPGDVEAIVREVAETFGALPARQPVPKRASMVPKLPVPPPGTVQTLEYRSADRIAYAIVEFPVPNMGNYARWVKQDLLTRLIGERMRNELRFATGESYVVSAAQEMASPNWLQIRADASPEKARDAAQRIVATVEAVARRPFTQEELSRAMPVARRLLEDRWNNAALKLGIWRGQINAAARLNNLDRTGKIIDQVSLDEVNRLAEDLLRPERARTYLVVPETMNAKRIE